MTARHKKLITQDLGHRLKGVQDAVFIGYVGVTAEESGDLRAILRETGAQLTVLKNSLASRAFRDLGVELPESCFVGPTAVIYGDVDAITASKTIADWSKKNGKDISFKAGLLDGRPLEAEEAERLTLIPGIQELKQMVVSLIASPLIGLVDVTHNILAGVPGVLNAIAEKKKEEGD